VREKKCERKKENAQPDLRASPSVFRKLEKRTKGCNYPNLFDHVLHFCIEITQKSWKKTLETDIRLLK
jgi:hypothetical protein